MAQRISIEAGLIRLQVPSKADVFYTEQLKMDEYLFNYLFTSSLIKEPQQLITGAYAGEYWWESLKNKDSIYLELSGEDTVIKGYYEDRYDGYKYGYTIYDLTIYVLYEEDSQLLEKEKNPAPAETLQQSMQAELLVEVEQK